MVIGRSWCTGMVGAGIDADHHSRCRIAPGIHEAQDGVRDAAS